MPVDIDPEEYAWIIINELIQKYEFIRRDYTKEELEIPRENLE